MAIREMKDVLGSIKERVCVKQGKTYVSYEAYFGTRRDGSQIRKYYCSGEVARKEVKLYFRGLKNSGEGLADLKPSEVYDAKGAFDILAAHQAGLTLTEVARRFTEQNRKQAAAPVTLCAAYGEYLSSYPDVQQRQRSCIAGRVGKWVSHVGGGVMCSDVQAKGIAQYLAGFDGRPVKTWNNHMTYIKSFCSWCCKKERGYMADNPMSDMRARKAAAEPPKFMGVDDFERLVRDIEADAAARWMLGYVVLSYFCGVRTEEIKRLAEDVRDIRPEEGAVIIRRPKGWTQGMAPRVIPVPENALAWMRGIDFSASLSRMGIPKVVVRFGAYARRHGVDVVHNSGRHTFGTMHVAAFGEPHKTAAMMGTSGSMLVNHYRGLATPAAGKRFFGIMPARQTED